MQQKIHIQKHSKLASIWKYLPYILASVFAITFALTIILSYSKITEALDNFLSNNLNLKLEHIYISGVENTNKENLQNAINLQKGESIFAISTKDIRENIESLPWVRLAQVQRIIPDTLKIKIIEHKAIATIKFDNRRWALNSKGQLINPVNEDFNYLLELSGKNAKDNAAGFFSLFAEWTDLLFLTKQAEFIGQRRWNLFLENGTLIMLPEENVRYALKVLKVLNSQQKILKKDKIKIDLRNVQKHIIIDEQNNLV